MAQPNHAKSLLVVAADCCGALLLFLYALLIGPLGVLRGPIALERGFHYLWVLAPQGLLAQSVRAMIDWRLGQFDGAISQLESLIGSCEEYARLKADSRARRRVLEDLYTVLARAYLHAGHIDDAMLVVIRAKKSLGIERLPGLAELDAKTAHLVRAGLAAGRLLDGGGLATLFVKSNSQVPASEAKRQGATKAPSATERDPQRNGAATGVRTTQAAERGNVIPFRSGGATSPATASPPTQTTESPSPPDQPHN